MRRRQAAAATLAVYGAVLLGAAVAPAAIGADDASGEVEVTNRETVNVKTDASGDVTAARIYDQVTITGTGEVDIANPISTKDLRNLEGFGGMTIEEDSVVTTVSVNGQVRQRHLAEFTEKLPVDIRVSYELDGEAIQPEDVAGKTGELTVTYRVANVTGEPTQITYKDGAGKTVTSTEQVYIPLASTLSMVLPNTMSNVQAPAGAVAGDGRGGTKLTFSITLIPPISNPESTVSYTAYVTDAAVPPANLSVAVIKPLENPTVAGAKKSFEDGAGTGAKLTDGAQQIDDNLLKLQEGAGQLLGGLIKLQDGSEQLAAGLNDTAVPGAEKLADGSEELAAGLNDTAVPGAEALAAGSEDLASGLNGTAVPGAEKLATGSAQVADGLDQLNAKIPALTAGISSLATGSAQVAAGLNQLEAGLDAPLPNGFGAGLQALSDGLATLPGTVSALKAGVQSIASTDCGFAGCQQTVAGVVAQISAKEPDIALAAGTAAALNNAYKTQIRPSIGQLSTGADQVAAGLAQLNAQIGPLATAVAQLAAGAEQVADGNAELAGGLTEAADGSTLIADGNAELASGLTGAADGATQIADGNAELASGLTDAADGSEQIADGLSQAAPGASQIEDGAGRLSAEGSSQLIAAGNATALDFGARVAIIEASAERTADGGLPYGAPEGATAASAAYSYDIAGVGGLSDSNTTRAIVAILILVGAAAGASVLARR